MNDWFLVSSVPTRVISAKSDQIIVNLSILAIVMILVVTVRSWDLVLQYRRHNETLLNLAFTDKVTGFSNWDKFCIDTRELLEAHPNQTFVDIALDIKKFKLVNELFGREKGDKLLQILAQLIHDTLLEHELFCHISADHFNLLLRYENEAQTILRIESLLAALQLNVPTYKLEFLAGACVIQDPDPDISHWSERAGISKSIAKKQPDAFCRFYVAQDRSELVREQEIESVMEEALRDREFKVYLQPKIDLQTNKLQGAEALVRWHKPDGTTVFPNDFIPLFEKNGFIKKLDFYMFGEVCALLRQWLACGYAPCPVSVNISRVNLNNARLSEDLRDIAQNYGIPPHLLEIELTESAIFADADNIVSAVDKIKAAGFLLSIDDFGSGYSSLGSIKDLLADFVKIDRSFLLDAEKSDRGKKIFHSIVSLTHSLNIQSVAEGVETEHHLEILHNAGCDIAQGYFYSKPIAAAEFERRFFDALPTNQPT